MCARPPACVPRVRGSRQHVDGGRAPGGRARLCSRSLSCICHKVGRERAHRRPERTGSTCADPPAPPSVVSGTFLSCGFGHRSSPRELGATRSTVSPGPRGSPGRVGSGAGKVSARVAAGPLALRPLPPLTVQLWPCRANRAGRSDEPDLEVAPPSQKHSHRPEGPVAAPSSALSGRDVGPARHGAAPPPASQARIPRGRPRFGARPPCSDITPSGQQLRSRPGQLLLGRRGLGSSAQFRCVRSGA